MRKTCRPFDVTNFSSVASVLDRLPKSTRRRQRLRSESDATVSSALRDGAEEFLEIARSLDERPNAFGLFDRNERDNPRSWIVDPESCDFREAAELKASLLRDAAHRGASDVCELLLHHDASPDSPDGGGQTAVHLAAIGGHVTVLDVFRRFTVNVSLCRLDAEGRTPVSHAVANGHAHCVYWLLKNDAELDKSALKELQQCSVDSPVRDAIAAFQKGEPLCDSKPLEPVTVADTSRDDEKIKEELQATREANEQLKLKVKELSHENVAIKGKMAGLQMEKKRNEVSWQEQLERKQKECDDLREEVSSLQAEIESLKANQDNEKLDALMSNRNFIEMKYLDNFLEVEWLSRQLARRDSVHAEGSFEATQQNLFLSLAKKMGHPWKLIGAALHIDDAALENLEFQHRFCQMTCAYMMLRMWSQSQGERASHSQLIDAFGELERKDLIELIKAQEEGEV